MKKTEYEQWIKERENKIYPTRYYASKQRKQNEIVFKLQDGTGYILITMEEYLEYIHLPKIIIRGNNDK